MIVSESYVAEYINVNSNFNLDELRNETDALVSNTVTIEETFLAQDLNMTAKNPLSYSPIKYGADGNGMAANVHFELRANPGQAKHYRLDK